MYPKAYLIYCYSLLVFCALMGCLLIRKSWPMGYRVLVALSCTTLAVEIAAFVCQSNQPPIYYIYNVWIFLEPMSIIFILSLGAMQPVVKRLCRVLLGVLPIGAVICYILSPGFEDRVNEYANLFYLFASLIAACLVLTDILRDMSDRPPFAQPVLSLAAGILFYSSTFILIHAIGAFYPLLMSKYYIYFSAVGNTFLYGGFIACYFALRRKDKEAIIATLSSSSSPD